MDRAWTWVFNRFREAASFTLTNTTFSSVVSGLYFHYERFITRVILFFKKDFTYLFLDRGEGREKERERNINVWLPLMHTPYWGPGLQPRHVPWLGIEPVTLWFTGWRSIHWAAPARNPCNSKKGILFFFKIEKSFFNWLTTFIGITSFLWF